MDSLTAEVADKLRCPVCRNQSVLESTATLSRQMQSVIREKLAAGESPEEIKAYFVDKYGEWILLRPEAEGIGLLVYVLPALALLAGGILVTVVLRRWSRASADDRRENHAGGGDGDDDQGLEDLAPEERRWIRQQVGSA
jgi:cytochrome c-type biogenesis protein CcmH